MKCVWNNAIEMNMSNTLSRLQFKGELKLMNVRCIRKTERTNIWCPDYSKYDPYNRIKSSHKWRVSLYPFISFRSAEPFVLHAVSKHLIVGDMVWNISTCKLVNSTEMLKLMSSMVINVFPVSESFGNRYQRINPWRYYLRSYNTDRD